MKAKYHIVILLGSLTLFYAGYNFVPHHQHLDNMHSHDGCDRHKPAGHHQETDEPRGHCHAFNKFEYVLSFANSFKPKLKNLPIMDFLAPADCCGEPDGEKVFSYRSVGPPQYSPEDFTDSAGSRAPPLA